MIGLTLLTGCRLPWSAPLPASPIAILKSADAALADMAFTNVSEWPGARLFDYMDGNLALTDMPPLTADVVRERGATLAAAQYVNPLPVLLELRYYEFRKLLTGEENSGFFTKIVGPEEGPRLATGPVEQRKEIVQRWLGRAE